MNESNLLIRIVLAIVFVLAVFFVIGLLTPLFAGTIEARFLNAIVGLLQLAAVVAGIYYVFTGRRNF